MRGPERMDRVGMASPKIEPTAVVVPFGVPEARRGLGLGLAALVHGFARLDGESVGLAQIFGKRADEPDAAPGPVEAFIPPNAWRDMAGHGSAPADVKIVLTGSFEPPDGSGGTLRMLAFDAGDGALRAQVDVHVDGDRAGEAIVDAVQKVCSGFGGDTGELSALRDLPWDALESVLRAERCALHDPARGGPHDRLAAMVHLGRAIEEAPGSRYPSGRLAVIALDTALGPAADRRSAEAAVRAVARAVVDAPDQPDLLEAMAALQARLGHTGIARDPARPRLYVVLSEARRARGDVAGARRAVEEGTARAPKDPSLGVERGTVLALAGDLAGAERAWLDVLARDPLYPAAYTSLATLASKRGDAILAQTLVDQALAGKHAHPEVLRCALRLGFASESEGVARGARIATLARALLARTPEDAGAVMALAQSLAQTGDTREAVAHYAKVESMAPHAQIAAEAQRARFALAEPLASQEVDSVRRAASAADTGVEALDALSVRARRLAMEHATWVAWHTFAMIERRRCAWASAREALVSALAASEGCSVAHADLARTYVKLGDAESAVRHAERAIAIEGETPRALGTLAEARVASGARAEGEALLARAVALAPDDTVLREIDAGVRRPSQAAPGMVARAREAIARIAKR
jgi:tetratricopeptide (TPR) repeat protein